MTIETMEFRGKLPILKIPASVWSKLIALARHFHTVKNTEVGMWCKLTHNENEVALNSVFIPPQRIAGMAFRHGPEDMKTLKDDPHAKELVGCACEIHSHQNGGCFMSELDEEMFEKWVSTTKTGVFVYGIINVHEDFFFRIWIPKYKLIYKPTVVIEHDADISQLIERAETRIVASGFKAIHSKGGKDMKQFAGLDVVGEVFGEYEDSIHMEVADLLEEVAAALDIHTNEHGYSNKYEDTMDELSNEFFETGTPYSLAVVIYWRDLLSQWKEFLMTDISRGYKIVTKSLARMSKIQEII